MSKSLDDLLWQAYRAGWLGAERALDRLVEDDGIAVGDFERWRRTIGEDE